MAAVLAISWLAQPAVPAEGESAKAMPRAAAVLQRKDGSGWWNPSSGEVMQSRAAYVNGSGIIEVFNASGDLPTRGHPFFEALGRNGRACVSCHQPKDGMSLSAATVRERWERTRGKDPIFAAIDGSNCPSLPQAQRSSHSLLLDKGLFRIPLPWPPQGPDAPRPEFDIDVVNDPTGCNTSATYGLKSASPRISVYRRPRLVANLSYVESPRPLGLWQVRTGVPLALDPEDGSRRLANNLMADGRAPTLLAQMQDASETHLQMLGSLKKEDLQTLRRFELQLYAAQVADHRGGSLQAGGAHSGPQAIAKGEIAVLGAFPHEPMFPDLEGWRTQATIAAANYRYTMKPVLQPGTRPDADRETAAEKAYRDSVARGYDSFMYRPFLIRDVGSLNPLLGNPLKQSCVNCHNMQRSGLDNAPGYLGLGSTTYPTATPQPDLPLFKLTCRADAPPHPYLGRVIYSHDPGRAMVTGKCSDIGAITAQQLRALAARAPYFANGSAKSLREVVEFYDRRFNIGYSEQDIQDMVNFLGAL